MKHSSIDKALAVWRKKRGLEETLPLFLEGELGYRKDGRYDAALRLPAPPKSESSAYVPMRERAYEQYYLSRGWSEYTEQRWKGGYETFKVRHAWPKEAK